MNGIRSLYDMAHGRDASPTETLFAQQYRLIHKKKMVAEKHWRETVKLMSRGNMCAGLSGQKQVRCNEQEAMGRLGPVAFQDRCWLC